MRTGLAWAVVLLALPASVVGQGQKMPPLPPATPPATAPVAAANAPAKISLDEAIRLSLQHNHALQAARTTILQNQAEEVTANLRPNPTLSWDSQFFPLFNPSQFSADYLENQAQFDVGIGYTFERGKKRQHRLQAAKDQTAVSRSTVTDNERTLIFNTSQQFISVLLAQSTLDLANQDAESFAQTVNISDARYKSGDMSESDLLKIKLQLLQFQSDVSAAKLAKIQALAGLRQFLGFESVPDQFDVQGDLDYQPVHADMEALKGLAMQDRPDLRAAQEGVTAARSQEALERANGKKDLGVSFDYTHTAGINSGAFFFNIDLPIFDRNQGEIAKARFAINQAEETALETAQQVNTDIVDAYGALKSNDEIIQLYRSGYIDQAKQSRDITEYAYKRGAASLLDFLDAERTYRASQLAYRQALASYMTALEQMRQAVGTRNLP
jgi:cobalt-zinc-cadmium efflux system outer membrane protein